MFFFYIKPNIFVSSMFQSSQLYKTYFKTPPLLFHQKHVCRSNIYKFQQESSIEYLLQEAKRSYRGFVLVLVSFFKQLCFKFATHFAECKRCITPSVTFLLSVSLQVPNLLYGSQTFVCCGFSADSIRTINLNKRYR